ncbi:MAG: TlpA family protein disulfide reductase [Gammaproteobacteria bacterium]|nr:TlpA family protein disulfide reductase [Gammaproteobacteria bacterium]
MQKQVKTIFISFIALLILVATYYFNPHAIQITTNTADTPATTIRPTFVLPDLEGQTHNVSEWDGKVIMVNFWATWCPPCRSEMPAFNKLYSNYKEQGFVIIGIAIDSSDSVQNFVDLMDIQYPILTSEDNGIRLAKAYGNELGALPFTAIIDQNGHIIQTHRGELSYEEAEAIITPLL